MEKNTRKSLVSRFIQVGATSFLSKLLGIVREILQVKYFGKPGALSDAFSVAFRIPNILRKVFAEGALSAALVPTLVQLNKENDEQLHKLITLFSFVLTAVILLVCAAVMVWAPQVVLFVAPGYAQKPLELSIAVPLVRILIFFVLFISSAALFAGALQSKQKFLVISWGPIILNIAYLTGLFICISHGLPVRYLALFLLLGGFFQVAVFLYAYHASDMKFSMPDNQTWLHFEQVAVKFFPCLLAVGASELNLFIDTQFASALPSGHYTVLGLAYRFMAIALSLFGVAFSSVLLPYLSKFSGYAPRRIGYYFFESAKLIVWITIPVACLMFFFSYDVFYTIFYRCTSTFPLEDVLLGAWYLRGFVWALSFFSLNKILLSIFYARHSTTFPSLVTGTGALLNYGLNTLLVPQYGAFGLALATSISEVVQTVSFMLGFIYFLRLPFYGRQFVRFMWGFAKQCAFFAVIFFVLYYIVTHLVGYSTELCSDVVLHHLGLWLWVGPLALSLFYAMLKTRKKFGIQMYFLG